MKRLIERSPVEGKLFKLLKQHAPAISAGASAFAAVAASISAIVATGALLQTTRIATNSDATVRATTRAYIAVTGARFDGLPEAGKNLRIKIMIENVGTDAAADVSHAWGWSGSAFEVKPDAKGMPYIWMKTTQWPRVEKCSAEVVLNSRPIYPKNPSEFPVYIFNSGPDFLPASVVEGRASFYVVGCFTYRTLGQMRMSPYCFYYQPARGKRVEEGTFEWCPSGTGNPT